MKRYIDILNKCGVKAWFIKEESRRTTELFFIKKKLDMRRVNDSTDLTVSLYVDEEKDGKMLRGRTDVIIAESMTDTEIEEKIKNGIYAAGFALNPFYEFPDPVKSDTVIMESDLNAMSLADIAGAVADSVYEEDVEADSFINSLEIFAGEYKERIVSSTGTDVSFSKRKIAGEFVAQCKSPQDVETYQDFEYDSLAIKELKKLVKDTLKLTRDRALARNMPKTGRMDVIISDKYVPTLMSFYFERANAGMIYPHYSNYELGMKVQGDDVKGDVLNIKYAPVNPFNDEGIPMIERPFIEDGVLKTICGNMRFSYYLGIPQIGNYEKGIVPAGKTSLEDMKKNCLHIVNFSDFQCDGFDGSFKGEIRLAYYYDEKGNVSLLTGGSVNGSLLECQKDMTFSCETESLMNYDGPLAIKLKNVAIAGE